MLAISNEVPMAKKKSTPPGPAEPENRVTVANVKGSEAERDYLKALNRETGVPVAEIIRRGVAMWAKSRGLKNAPADWVGK